MTFESKAHFFFKLLSGSAVCSESEHLLVRSHVQLHDLLCEVESFKDSSDLAPVETDNSAFLLPGVHG